MQANELALLRLFTPSGALLATSTSPVAPDARKSRMHAALAANVWTNYEQATTQGIVDQLLPPLPADQNSPQQTYANSPLQALTLEFSEYNLHVQLVAPRVLRCLIGPNPAGQSSSRSSMHSNDGDLVFEGPGSYKSGGVKSGMATPAVGSMRGTPVTTPGAVGAAAGGVGGNLGILKAQAQALADYLGNELKGFELPEGI